ncbi:phosphatidate cytidylyltransferase [Flavihumibacter stibioxidans]|uniref:Phosphatidate cytidylyltransferase n=1 Tax=Flavihumibacter stibioxidans TaxID=1834163 RepID=A0ABR7M8H8_9BACT|nr:phosphatidate cytidylyltransferase [Flavihumibacter stibioxidans]MBC6491144.1 phosphatidate cytidylyltransferase [Flavihumibacter stibioxidans]
MAFNWQTFWTRAFTALIFVAVMLTGLLWNQWSFFILFTIVHFGCWVEYQRLVAKFEPDYAAITPFHRYGVMLAGWCFLLVFTSDEFSAGSLSLHAIGWWMGLLFLFMLPITELLFSRNIQLKNIRYSALGLLYISLSWGLLISLRTKPDYGYLLPLGIIFSIWINDTMAYLVGSMIGKTPLSAISPKKTWEGTIGGIIISIAAMCLLAWYTNLPILHTGIIATISAVAGTFGDLLESKLKRMAGVKDSGQIMPGHGGFMDRFDSLLFATPFVWLYVKLFL